MARKESRVSGHRSRYLVLCVDKKDAWASSETARGVLTCVCDGADEDRKIERGSKMVSRGGRTRSPRVTTSRDEEADLLRTYSLEGRREERVGRR